MLILGLFAGALFVGLTLWLLATLTIHALPTLIGISAASLAHHAGASPLGAGLIGFVSGAASLGAGRAVLAHAETGRARTTILLAFVVPAALAGFAATRGIVARILPFAPYQWPLSILGAAVIGRITMDRAQPRGTSKFRMRSSRVD